jgi:hypothetical protein
MSTNSSSNGGRGFLKAMNGILLCSYGFMRWQISRLRIHFEIRLCGILSFENRFSSLVVFLTPGCTNSSESWIRLIRFFLFIILNQPDRLFCFGACRAE